MNGCASDFDPSTLLSDVRVLAVKAEPPELGPGETATLTVLHYPEAGTTVDWSYCTERPLAGSSDAVNLDCIQKDTAPFIFPIGTGDTAQITMPAIALADIGLPDETGGFYLPVRVRVRGRVGDRPEKLDVGIYRLRYHVPGLPIPPNKNVRLADIFEHDEGANDGGAAAEVYRETDDGGAPFLDRCPARDAPETQTPPPGLSLPDNFTITSKQTIQLRAVFVPGSAESYLFGDPVTRSCNTLYEYPSVNWYASAGTLSGETTGENGEVALTIDDQHAPADGAKIELYAVGRDDRGGTDWLHRTLTFKK